MFSVNTLLLALVASTSAHMILTNPVPYGVDTLNNSPLGPGDFPCKQRAGVYDITKMNQWNAGETQIISFKGSVVHGGGSCQFSLTTDMEPTESTQWKVIHSIEGGCPSNVTGNITPEDPNGTLAAVFPVTMPKDIPDGQYTFAWTWLNKVGNREFYMNCAPVQVGSSSSTASTASVANTLSNLPDMFVANIPSVDCTTTEYEDFVYPEPGQSVALGEKATPGNSMKGSACKTGTGNGSPTQPESPAQSSAVSEQPVAEPPAYSAAPIESTAPVESPAPVPVQSPSPIESGTPSQPDGVFAPGASSAPVAQPSTPSAAEPIASPAQPSSAPTYGDAPTNSTPSTDGECTPCNNDGAVVCIGSNQFGLCNRGCAVAQDLAAGMSCSDGVVVSSAKKRSLRFPRAHLHRRHGASVLF
ncbi:hypothetical protein J1614_000593 [Plenodomus biglobosus]|nr:hypothetical protein J1614_000593 [Plenodomus biglobosus]